MPTRVKIAMGFSSEFLPVPPQLSYCSGGAFRMVWSCSKFEDPGETSRFVMVMAGPVPHVRSELDSDCAGILSLCLSFPFLLFPSNYVDIQN